MVNFETLQPLSSTLMKFSVAGCAIVYQTSPERKCLPSTAAFSHCKLAEATSTLQMDSLFGPFWKRLAKAQSDTVSDSVPNTPVWCHRLNISVILGMQCYPGSSTSFPQHRLCHSRSHSIKHQEEVKKQALSQGCSRDPGRSLPCSKLYKNV